MDCNPPDFLAYRILRARTLERVAMPSSGGSSQPRIEPTSLTSPALAGRFFTSSATWEVPIGSAQRINCWYVCVCMLQSCLTLCDRMDCSPPGSSVHGIPQAIILEWGTIPFPRVSCATGSSLLTEPPGKPSTILSNLFGGIPPTHALKPHIHLNR